MNVLCLFVAFWLLLKQSFSTTNTCPKACQNDGVCVSQGDSYGCQCPCNFTGDHCQFKNWCPHAKFSKVGCLSVTASKKPLLSYTDISITATADEWNRHLEEVTCSCALAARSRGFKYFSLGETWCVGYNETEVSVDNTSLTGCRGQDLNDCHDNSSLVPCVGGAGYQYVYELSLTDQLRCENEIRDCADYDYIVRIHDVPKDWYFGPIEDAFPVGTPFSFCIWIKTSKDSVTHSNQAYFIISYSVPNNHNHFTLTLEATSEEDDFILLYIFDESRYRRPHTIPGGIFNKWFHICSVVDPVAKTITTYLNGTYFDQLQPSPFVPIRSSGLLIIGRDQDSHGGGFGTADVYFGDVALFNVWSYLLSEDEVAHVYTGPGTQRGNHLAWTDLKKYLHGVSAIRDSPVMKWSGDGCRWVSGDCSEQNGVCKRTLFQCPCRSNFTAPRSCVSSDIYETKPCSDHDYFLEFPSTEQRVRMNVTNTLLRTWHFSVCLWLKYPPGSTYYHSIVFVGQPTKSIFHLFLGNNQKSFVIKSKTKDLAWTWSDETYANNQWFHLCGVQDYSKFTMYRNGVSLGEKTYPSASPIEGDVQLIIGDNLKNHNSLWSFTGSIAHLNIWDKVLSDATITDIAGGGRTYVGSLIGWPDFQKRFLVPKIRVRRPSPLMKWPNNTCHWSKDSCIVGQLCNGAKYVCPPLQLNEVLPHSCGVSLHQKRIGDFSENQAWKPRPVLDLILVSRDQDTVDSLDGVGYSSVFVNDIEYKLSGSKMFFIVLNALTGSLVKQFSCDAYTNTACNTELQEKLNEIRVERITIMVILDSAGEHYGEAIPAMHSTFGEELYITNTLGIREPFTLLGYSGFNDVSWRQSKILERYKGPSIIETSVPLLRESCLDHMYMGERVNGKYVVYPRGGREITVYCDFTTNGGGWTVIQRRHKGELPFPVDVGAYQNGFGAVDGEFWLGNEKINRLGDGQLLAIIYQNASSLTYDLYKDFYVRVSSELDVSGRTGIMDESIFVSSGYIPLKFVAPKGLATPSSCVSKSDGGWWFGSTCEGSNLNAERKECNDSRLATEMLFRQRLPSNDIVIKEISMKMTYQDGMDACLIDGLRICSSMEICRDGKTVTGGAVKDFYWVPIADYYNRWINIGTQDESRICEIEDSPSWGTNVTFSEQKGRVYCCPERGPWLPSKYTVPQTYTYLEGMAECARKKQRLCTRKEICPDGVSPQHGIANSETWVRVLDRFNEWVQIGNVDSLCSGYYESHGTAPAWGITNQAVTGKSILYCCPLIFEGRIARTWKYDLKFHGNLSYVRFPKITPLQKATVCWWMLLNVAFKKWKTVFSYRSMDTNELLLEFAVKVDGKFQLTVGRDSRESQFPPLFLDNHEYHHICILWNCLTRAASVYRDGMLISSFADFKIPPTPPTGSLIIGQSYKTPSSLDPERSFQGLITRFNIWDNELEADIIDNRSIACGEEEGSIIAWPEVKLWTYDGVEIIEGDHCFPENCMDYLYRNKRKSGLYEVRSLKNSSSIRVYCDQDTVGGGWISIGERAGGAVTFHDKTFKEFKDGFGDLEGEFWLGHEKIHLLTSGQTQDSLVSGKGENHGIFGVLMQWFMLGREESNYKILFSTSSGTTNKLTVNRPFVTEDQDTADNCGQDYGPFWHKEGPSCLEANLFGDLSVGGNKGAQYWGKYEGKLTHLQWKIRPSNEFKKRQQVMYWTNNNLNWSAGKEFCQSKGLDLCTSNVLCSTQNNYPFGAHLNGLRRTPVIDSYGKWINIGEAQTCTVLTPVNGNDNKVFLYKRRIICCRGFPKRDWRFDLRFHEGTDGHIKTETTNIDSYSICWWLRVTPFSQAFATVFTFLFQSGKIMRFSYTGDGTLLGEVDQLISVKNVPAVIDGKWHHYCLLQHTDHIDVFFDGELTFVFYLGSYTDTLTGQLLIIGQDADSSGNIVSGRGLVGELSRFNWWNQKLYNWQVLKMSQKCGGEIGNLIAWPDLKYSTVGDVEYIPETSCIKPEKHFWPFNEVSEDGMAYKDVISDYDLQTSSEDVLKPGHTLSLSQEKFVENKISVDDCLSDPELCRRTGLTIGMWLKRKGLSSKILPESDANHVQLLKWLDTASTDVSDWLLCFNHSGSNMNVAEFHAGCDYLGATVTLLKVGSNIFGGFSNENWGGPTRHISSHSSFLFSLYNPSNIGPVKLEVISERNASALYTDEQHGPTFGANFDLKITSAEGSSALGQTYNVPPGFTAGSAAARYFFTSTEQFKIDHIEVFYAYVPSEAVGIEFSSVIKDDQMTASYYQTLPTNGPHNARLYSNDKWQTAWKDLSPWLQVKLNDVMKIGKIAIQGCGTTWVNRFKLNYSMDGVHWTVHKEHMTEKTFTGNSNGANVVYHTLQSAFKTKYVRIVPVDVDGAHICMKIELYASVQVCPNTSSGAVACPKASSVVTQATCERVGCCFLASACFSKQETFTEVGMQSGLIKDESITASSWKANSLPYTARFNTKYIGWQSSVKGFPQWLQVELNQDELLTHIATQGNTPSPTLSYCKSYMIYYRKSTDVFTVYTENGHPRVFEGYGERTRTIKNLFLKPFVARFVRLYPQHIPTEKVRIELYRALKGSGTSILSTTHLASNRPTGISLRQHTLTRYRFAVQTDSVLWELLWKYNTYQWTHVIFTWNEQLGIQFYENGVFKMQSSEPSQFTEAKFIRSSELFLVGDNRITKTVPQSFNMANLFVLKRYVLPEEAKSFVYDVPCNFGDTSQCVWNNTNWNMTDLPTPSRDTGPMEGLRIRNFRNLALGKRTTQSSTLTKNGVNHNSSFAVDGSLHLTCAVTLAGASWWNVDIGELRRIELVVIFQKPEYDPNKLVQYVVSISAVSQVTGYKDCYEFGEDYGYTGERSFYCNQTEDVRYVAVANVDTAMPLTVCEVAVYTMASDVFSYLEASYPAEKGFSGVLTTQYFAEYNCLHFSYHMYGNNMGRLNVFGPRASQDSNKTLLWRLAGDQGNEWQSAVVRLENNHLQDFYEVSFEAVVGDGYMSDIALDNVVFTVDSECFNHPLSAVPTITVASSRDDCLCLSTFGSVSENYLTVKTCASLTQGFEWLSDGVLLYEGKCVRPAVNNVTDGTKLVMGTSCNVNEVAFRLTPTGAVQHVNSLMCLQTAEWRKEVKENEQLVLGTQGCYDVNWSWVTILLKDSTGISYSKMNILKLGTGAISCGAYDGSLLHFIPASVDTTQPGAQVVTYVQATGTFRSGTVLKVNENNSTFVVSLSETENIEVSAENSTKTPNQPIRGSSILELQRAHARVLSEWLAARGIFSEFWRPCVYKSREGMARFNCSLNNDVPTLLIIREEGVLVGGFMDRRSARPTRNFLFSLKKSSSLKFNETSGSGADGALLTETGMSFGENNEELAITWTGEPQVKNIPGSMFGITDLNSMVGEQQFAAADFEVLQPKDEICLPRCKSNEVCDQISGKCICDPTGRPPAWCLTGAASETIFIDASHFWSVDSAFNIIDEKAENIGWALVEGHLKHNVGVNGPSIEIQDSEGSVELLSDEFCFRKPKNCNLTISFWFKSIETKQSSIDGRMFLKSSYDIDTHTGIFLFQGNNRGEVVFRTRRTLQQCFQTFYIEPNLWTFVTLINQDVYWKILLNNIKAEVTKECSSLTSIKNPQGKLILGNGGSACSALFDDVAVWHRQLSDDEVENIYRYYYKDPATLAATLEVKFSNFVWDNEMLDKESGMWKSLQNTVYSEFGALFPGHQNSSFAIDTCRDASPLVCNVELRLNGSDYEMVEILEKEDIIPDRVISNLKTDRVFYNPTVFKTNPEASKIILEWSSNLTNLYQGFMISYMNNKTNETFNVTENKFESMYELGNLTGYSHYFIKFALYTLAGVGKWSEKIVQTAEDAPKYPPSNLVGQNVSSTGLTVQWDAVTEENTYKELRGYVVYVVEASTSLIVKNITTNTTTLDVLIDNLRKFVTYSIYVRAYTVDVGVQSLTLNLTTAEDAPDAPPDNFHVFNSSSTSLRIEFNPVPPDLINGILRGYRVFYYKTREGNDTRKNFTITKEPGSNTVLYRRRKRSVGQYHEGYPLFADIYNLEEYTNYTVQIQAITVEDGVLAPPFTALTGEDLPSMAPPNVTARNSSSTSVMLEWDLIPEEDRNGVLLGYVVYYIGRDRVEQKFVYESTSLVLDLQGLEKFTEYSFELTVFNSIGESNRSDVVSCKTDQDRPDLPPQDIIGTPTSPSTMGITWKPIPFPFVRGILLGYHMIFSTMSGEVLVSKILAIDELFTSVGDLELFTNYTLNMTAFTIKGNGPWSSQVVLSLQIAPTIPPLNLTADSFFTLNSIPVHWIKVPPELTKGYIIGYRLYIKLISVGLEEVPDTTAKEIVLKGAPSSYVFEDLDFFSEYMIYLVAYTVGGDSPRSNTIYAETCRCGPVLSSQWSNLAPYTNITNPENYNEKMLKNSWGIFPYIVDDAVTSCCQTCRTHNYSSVDFTRNVHGQPSEVFGNEALINSIDGLTDLTFPVYGYLGQTVYHSLYKYTPLIESPGSAFLVRKEGSNMSEMLIANILGNWPLAVMIVCMAFAAGAIMWWLEKSDNSEEFPPSALKGVFNGFWWAYVTMTTVGYGDRSPRTRFGRIFAIAWTLVGLIITGIMVGNLASSLTVSVTEVDKIIYGTQVGALELSPEFRLGIRLNAKMNTVRPYQTLDELYQALLNGEVDGILLDAYVVGSRKDLFKNPNIVVKKIKDYRTAYGIVWAGRSARMKVCLDWYMKRMRSKMFSHIAGNLHMVKKIDSKDVQEEMANIFDPTTQLYSGTMFLCLVSLAVLVGLGLVYELIRRRRRAMKVKPQGSVDNETQRTQAMDEFLHESLASIVSRADATKAKHLQQLKFFRNKSWFKKS